MKKYLATMVSLFLMLYATHGTCEKITIFGNESKPPKYYLENGQAKGILVDIMRYVDSHSRYEIMFELYPWKRAYSRAQWGKGGIMGLSKTTERLAIFDYSEVMFHDDLLLVVIKGNEFRYENIDDLKGKKVGIGFGSSYGDEFERGKKNIFTVSEDSSAVQRLKKLRAGRIDVALIGPGKPGFDQVFTDAPELLKHKQDFVILDTPFKRDPNYLGFAKSMKKQEFLQEFNRILRHGQESGVIQKIIDKHTRENKRSVANQ